MIVAAPAKRNIIATLFVEPLELAVSQPHQAFISALSVYLVASEAAMLAPAPFNWLMAVGAEWAYLRGLSSGDFVRSVWTKRLITSAVVLLVLYGSLFGLRRFGVLPADAAYYAANQVRDLWGVIGAIALTLVHILSIGAVTFCSAMIHRDTLEAQRVSREKAAAEEAQRAEDARQQKESARLCEEKRQALLQAERDQLALEMERKRQELAIWEQAQDVKARVKMQSTNARTKMRRDALPMSTDADEKRCPKCGEELDRPHWLAARRWGYCMACKERQDKGE